MGRPSKLSEKQWAQLESRLLKGEKAKDLSREYKVSPAVISRRFANSAKTIKDVANQVVAADAALKSLPVSQQAIAISLIDELKAISMHLAGAGKYGAATSHRLSGIAHAKVQEIDDATPLTAESLEALKGVAVLTKLANDSAVIPMGLLAANKEMVKEANSGAQSEPGQLLAELVQHLPD
jgi:hypothetical protein